VCGLRYSGGSGCGGDGWGIGYVLFTAVFMDAGFVEGRQRLGWGR
jgi:hypothetical protein